MKLTEVIHKGLENYKDEVLLVARLAMGFMFIYVHGGPKVFGGPEKWLEVGSMLKVLGITTAPQLLGLMAGLYELVGGILISFGLFTRVGAALALSNLLIASLVMYNLKGLSGAAPAFEDSLFMLILLAVGAGKYSLDYKWFSKG